MNAQFARRLRQLSALTLALNVAPFSNAQDDPYAFFEAKVRPVLVEHCYSCHSAATDKPKGGLRLDYAAALLKGGDSGIAAIVPGQAETSRLIAAVRCADPDLKMPPKEKLSDAQIEALVAWVNSGAPDPRKDVPTPAKAAPKKDHWAFKQPVATAEPVVHDTAWPHTSVDRFVMAKLEEKGLRPAAQANRRTLIRRAYYDLLGLPPTAEAVERFVSDPDPNAFEKLVDELLASPHYGERWARHWLDVARYADTKGYVYPEREEAKFFHSYVYRDWVIRALNDDMPYDQFLRYQIASDQIPGPGGEDERAALGFLTLGRRFLGVVHDIIDDRIDVVMRGTQAMTMGCARCHDHKFDPLSTKDYYALYGVFAGSSERIVSVPGAAEDPAKTPAFQAEWHKRKNALRSEFSARKDTLAALLRTQTDRYLNAALHASTFPSDEFYEIRGPDDLNPTIVWQWRRYLDRQREDDPIWGAWRRSEKAPAANLAAEAAALDPSRDNALLVAALQAQPLGSMQEVAAAYGRVFLHANQEWLELERRCGENDEADARQFDDFALEQVRAALYAPDAPVMAPKGPMVDVEWYFDEPSRLALTKLSKSLETLLLTNPGSPPHVLALEDKEQQRNPCVFKRGSAANKGEEVHRRFPEILGGSEDAPFAHGSGRAELADAIADRNNPLTARVIVNRVWQWHFGEGLVRTTSDFGTRCEGPSHPELLDWLAVWFMDSGWSLKKLNRLILASAVWQEGGAAQDAAATVDPENKLLSHFIPERLDFEEMRDSLLAVSNSLSGDIGGKAVDLFKAPFTNRRTLYGNIDRTFLQGAYRVFDFPNPDMHGPQRSETTVPQQALFFMNSPFIKEQARALAKAVADTPEGNARTEALYRHVFQRVPDPHDEQLAADFVASIPSPDAAALAPPEPSPWQYGYGEYDANGQRMLSFEALPYFGDNAYQGSGTYPDAALGWIKLEANGGHPGNDRKHACVRRWVAPAAGDITISGTITHEPMEGSGIRAWVISSTQGELFGSRLHAEKKDTNAGPLHVVPGDTIDFVVDIGDKLGYNQFLWSAAISFTGDVSRTFDASKDFAPPVAMKPVPMTPWEQYAQVLLLSNQFAFVD